MLAVETARGPVVLASDAVHYYEELELERPFEILVDLDAMGAAYAPSASWPRSQARRSSPATTLR